MSGLGPLPKESDYSLKLRKASLEIRTMLFDARKRLKLTETQYLAILIEAMDEMMRGCLMCERADSE